MNVGLVTSMKYGLTQFIYRDVEALIERGNHVRLFALLQSKGLYNPKPDWDVVAASGLRAAAALATLLARRPRLGWQLFDHARRFRALPDLAVAADLHRSMDDVEVIFSYFGDHKLFVSYYCKRLTGQPLAVTIRAYELYRNPNPRMFVESLAACDAVLTITEHNKRMLVERYGVPESKISIVRQSLDLDLHASRPRLKVLIVGFFAEKKGHDVLLRALALLDRDDVELWVVGDWNPSIRSVDVRKLAAEVGVADRVAFFGAQSGVALRALYRECDVFCLPSRTDSLGDKEGFPNVIAEAMAFGKPVVSTRHAGIPEALDAILVDENDADQLAEGLRQALDSAELRRQLGERNRRRAEEMFSSDNHDDLAKALQEVAVVSRVPAGRGSR